jgi:hypothetical protein
MTLRQPIPQVRRHQEHLHTITLKKVLGHTQKCLNHTGQTGSCATPTVQSRHPMSAGRDDSFTRLQESECDEWALAWECPPGPVLDIGTVECDDVAPDSDFFVGVHRPG